MSLSRESIEHLLDLAEIKLSALLVVDRDDAREMKQLETARDELLGLLSLRQGKATAGEVVKFPC